MRRASDLGETAALVTWPYTRPAPLTGAPEGLRPSLRACLQHEAGMKTAALGHTWGGEAGGIEAKGLSNVHPLRRDCAYVCVCVHAEC